MGRFVSLSGWSSVLLLFVIACSRTPAEPAPPASISPPPTVASTALRPPLPTLACPADPQGQGNLETAVVTFSDAPGRPRVEVELAKRPHDTERGLMYRRQMAEDRGMFFQLGERREHIFWMHNTCIPLDMIFLDDDGTIVGIVENAEPLTDTPRSVGVPSTFVLEVSGGYSQRHFVRAGQKIAIPASVR